MNLAPSPWDEIPGINDPPKLVHVWLVSQTEPLAIETFEVDERDGELCLMTGMHFDGPKLTVAVRRFKAAEWFKWSIVNDEADRRD